MDLLWKPRNITSLHGLCYKAIDSWVSQNMFSYLKCLACNAEKTLQLKITKKRLNIANCINIYTNIYIYIVCDENDSK